MNTTKTTKPSVPTSSPERTEVEVSRRQLAAALVGGAGLLGLASCASPEPGTSTVAEELTGSNFLWADKLTDLRGVIGSDTGTNSKPAIVLGGLTSVGDGGGGVFYWDTSSSTGDNSYSIIVPTGSSTGRWIRVSGTNYLWADTLTDLRATIAVDAKHTSQPYLVLGGYGSVGDGGGGMFYWDSSSSTGDNGGTIIVPTGSSSGRWVRVYSGALNVRWFGAKGNGSNADDAAINSAITAGGVSGGEVYVPPGTYKTTASIVMNVNDVRLLGAGEASVIAPASGATFDTVSINGSYAGITISGLYFQESGKSLTSGANTIYALHVSRLSVIDCQIDHPVNGVRLYAVNTVEFERVRVAYVSGTGSFNYAFWVTGDGSGATNTVTFKNVAIQGPSTYPGSFGTTRHGVVVDGVVNTFSAYKLYSNGIEGRGLWFRNTMGSLNPEFATIYGYEAEYAQLEGILVDTLREGYFTDTQVHQSIQQNNITITSNASVISFKGGFSHGGFYIGIDISGKQISIAGMDVYSNSNAVTHLYYGIGLEASCRMVTITGTKCGDPGDGTQAGGIYIASGADQFAVVGNVCFNNPNSITNNTTAAPSRIVAKNATT